MNSTVRVTRIPLARAISSRFDRIDVETMVHSDGGFAAVSYLRVKGAILKEKPESRNDLTYPHYSKNPASFASKLSCVAITVGSSIHGVLELDTRQLSVQSRGSSGSRRNCWVAGGVFCTTSQDITCEKKDTRCFRDPQGSSPSIEGCHSDLS